MTFRGMVVRLRREARAGTCLPFVVTYEDQLVGQLTVGGIAWGSFRSAHVGYWIDSAVAGRGIMPTALALAVDHCFRTVGLHRIEINIRRRTCRVAASWRSWVSVTRGCVRGCCTSTVIGEIT